MGEGETVPNEYIEHLYRKEYGLTIWEYQEEPAEKIALFLKIRSLEILKDRQKPNGEV